MTWNMLTATLREWRRSRLEGNAKGTNSSQAFESAAEKDEED